MFIGVLLVTYAANGDKSRPSDGLNPTLCRLFREDLGRVKTGSKGSARMRALIFALCFAAITFANDCKLTPNSPVCRGLAMAPPPQPTPAPTQDSASVGLLSNDVSAQDSSGCAEMSLKPEAKAMAASLNTISTIMVMQMVVTGAVLVVSIIAAN
jgi:hypothetical protein